MREPNIASEDLAAMLTSPAVGWVRAEGLAVVLAHRGENVLRGQRLVSRDERAAGMGLLARWERALDAGKLAPVVVLAAAFASWAIGERGPDHGRVVDRAVDLTLRAGAIASDLRRLDALSSNPKESLRRAQRVCERLAIATTGVPRVDAALLVLDLEDAAARAAGEALVALLLAGEAP